MLLRLHRLPRQLRWLQRQRLHNSRYARFLIVVDYLQLRTAVPPLLALPLALTALAPTTNLRSPIHGTTR
jgi:hypothetical protein